MIETTTARYLCCVGITVVESTENEAAFVEQWTMNVSLGAEGTPLGCFVEFVGAAGVGKTHLAGMLLMELRVRGLDVTDIDRLPPSPVFQRLYWTLPAARLAALTRPVSIASWAYGTRQLLRYQLMQRRCEGAAGFHVTSEGIFHKLRGLFRHSRCGEMSQLAGLIFRSLPPPNAVVILSARPETVLVRRKKRARISDHFTEQSVIDDVIQMQCIVETIKQVQIVFAKRMQIINLDVDSPETAANVKDLADRLTCRIAA